MIFSLFIEDAFAPEKFVHIGGDEVWHTTNQSCWTSNPDIQSWLEKHSNINGFVGLETLFERNVINMLHTAGASVVVWQEIFDNDSVHQQKNTLIDVWKSNDGNNNTVWQHEMEKVTSAGYSAILSAPFYLNIISYGMDWWTYYQGKRF